jgi:hypothetical protein
VKDDPFVSALSSLATFSLARSLSTREIAVPRVSRIGPKAVDDVYRSAGSRRRLDVVAGDDDDNDDDDEDSVNASRFPSQTETGIITGETLRHDRRAKKTCTSIFILRSVFNYTGFNPPSLSRDESGGDGGGILRVSLARVR